MPEQTSHPEAISRWEVTLLRLTAFPRDPSSSARAGVWSQVVGQEPEKQLSKPRLGEIYEDGPYSTGLLSFFSQPTRLEWRIIPIAEENAVSPTPPTIGPVDVVLSKFTEITKKWLQGVDFAITRLAFGAQLLLPAVDHEDAYQKLSTYLPSIKLDLRSRDFSYQINRPRQSRTVDGLSINRLTKWSAVAWSLIPATPDIATLLSGLIMTSPAISCSLEEDINTEANRKDALPQQLLIGLFDELVAQGLEILDSGDIP